MYLLIECAMGILQTLKSADAQAPHEKQCNFYPELMRIVLCMLNHLYADDLYLMQCECYANSRHAIVFSD